MAATATASPITLNVTPVRTERAFEVVFRAIEAKILEGEWPVGSVLPGEVALAKAFGIHRSTMRESIRALEQEGFLQRPAGAKHLLVRAPTGALTASRMTTTIILQETTFRELWDTLLVIEPALAAAAATRATEAELLDLRRNLGTSRDNIDDPEALVLLDMAFLSTIARASRNRVLQLCRAPIGQLLYPAFIPVMRRAPAGRRLLQAHEALLQALVARDVDEAHARMRRHVIDFRRGYEAAGLDIDRPVPWPAAPSSPMGAPHQP